MKELEKIARWMGYVSSVLIFCLMLLIVANVVGRYFLRTPITGSTELASLMMTMIVFPSLAWAALEEKHVKVDLIVGRFSERTQAIFNVVTFIMALAVYIIITWRSYIVTPTVRTVTSMLSLPHTPFYWVMCIGWTVFCMSILVLIIKYLIKVVKR